MGLEWVLPRSRQGHWCVGKIGGLTLFLTLEGLFGCGGVLGENFAVERGRQKQWRPKNRLK